MFEMQKTIDGNYVAAHQPSVAQLLANVPDDIDPAKQVLLGYIGSPATQAFMVSACLITELHKMHDLYFDHLSSVQSFEGFARGRRDAVNGGGEKKKPTPKQKEAKLPPGWYQLYLVSDHWHRLRIAAMAHYGNCVLCGSEVDLETHHKHYNTIGHETLRDISLLCAVHHEEVHATFLGIHVPKNCPQGAIDKIGLRA